MSHSKRNTSRPVFTAHERALAKSNWTTSSARLSRDSFLPFGSCGLCLEIAREPVACPRGDLFCRECALANLVAQKRDLKRTDRARRDADAEAVKVRALGADEEQARAVRDFEMMQAGTARAQLQAKRSWEMPGPAKPVQNGEVETVKTGDSQALVEVGSKRKFALDEDEVTRIASEDRAKARKALDEEKAAKPTLPSFWTPSLTPDVSDNKALPSSKKDKSAPTCPSSSQDSPHAFSMQKLITIDFHEDEDESTKAKRCICPSCRKVLSNASTPVMAKQCGHVLCYNCVEKFLLPSARNKGAEGEALLACYVCDVPSKPAKADVPKGTLPPGLVMLRSEGTGFSARGANAVKRTGVGFQC